jgi:predicted transcriptional regulator
MPDAPLPRLGRRERQILDIVYRLGRAGVSDVRAALPDPPSYSAVRGMLNLLESKGCLRHARDGVRYVYLPTVPAATARKRALRHVVATFFGGSSSAAAAALLEMSGTRLSAEERARLLSLVARAEKEGR